MKAPIHDHETAPEPESVCEQCVEEWAHAPERETAAADAVVLRGHAARAWTQALLARVLTDSPATAAECAAARHAGTPLHES